MNPPNYGTVEPLNPPTDERRRDERRNTDATSHSRRSLGLDSRSIAMRESEFEEFDPFLPTRESSPSLDDEGVARPRRKVSSFWMLPIVMLSGFARGMTAAPRIEVYTQVACDEIHPNASSSSLVFNTTLSSLNATSSSVTPLLFAPRALGITNDIIPSSLVYTPFAYDDYFDGIHTSPTLGLEKKEVVVATPPPECLHDPVVQSRAAAIQATLGTIIGVLSIITSGYWGQISDAFGRKAILAFNMFGMLFQDIIYMLVNIPDSFFHRHAYKVLIIGPVVEGLVGSLTTHHAAENAYLADCAQSGSRSTIFAYYQGAGYIALASGPQVARLFLAISKSDPRTTMFYGGTILHAAALVFALFMPETVTREMMLAARRSVSGLRAHHDERFKERWSRKIKAGWERLLGPLTIFAPKRKPGGGWELNMTFLVVAQFTHLMSVGIWQLKLLYAQHTYAWSVKELGYYISLLWSLRAFHLLLLLPTILRFIRPIRSQRNSVALSQDLTFDYRVAQASIFIETTAYVLTLIAPSSNEVLFVVFTSLSSFTAGVNPAIHSLAVTYLFAFHNDANVGRMFGGMSMLQAISHTLQPILFGVVYSETAATYPKAIFALAAGLLIAASAMFTLLRTDVTSQRQDTEEAVSLIDEEREEETDERVADENESDDTLVRGREESNKPLQGLTQPSAPSG